jgi:enamine deaminase RidA (YjgF/YER057c/UK114 family)
MEQDSIQTKENEFYSSAEQSVKEGVVEVETAVDENVVEVEKVVDETVKKVKKPLSKNDESKALMKSAEMLVSKVNKDVKEVEDVVAEHVAEFKAKKEALADSTMAETKELLKKANYEYSDEEEMEPFELSLGCAKEKVDIKPIRGGHFSGLILGVLGAVATAGGWLYIAAQKTGTVINPESIPEQSALDKIFTWIGGGMTGSAGNAQFGMITVALSALFMGYLFYKMRISMKENKNFKVANRAFEKSHTYVEEQKESMTEMQRIDKHIIVATPLIEHYDVVLNEQNAKLKRILHVEGILDSMSEYHPNSKHIMDEAANLMKRAERFINAPVSKEGRFNEDSVNAYREAKALYSSFITQTYA